APSRPDRARNQIGAPAEARSHVLSAKGGRRATRPWTWRAVSTELHKFSPHVRTCMRRDVRGTWYSRHRGPVSVHAPGRGASFRAARASADAVRRDERGVSRRAGTPKGRHSPSEDRAAHRRGPAGATPRLRRTSETATPRGTLTLRRDRSGGKG